MAGQCIIVTGDAGSQGRLLVRSLPLVSALLTDPPLDLTIGPPSRASIDYPIAHLAFAGQLLEDPRQARGGDG
jgi:hypothetical protein